jgi:formylglycine-generating enzyme required for sulfatase activity
MFTKRTCTFDLSGLTATVKGANTQAAFNLATGTFGATSAPADIERLCTQQPTETAAVKYEAILLLAGSWSNSARYCRSAYRSYVSPDYANDSYGFRVVFVLP